MCFAWWMKEAEISPMEFLTELVDVLSVDSADITKERIVWMLEQSSFNSHDPQHVEFTTSQLQGIMAIARLLSKRKNFKNTSDLLGTLLKFLESLPLSCNQESFPKWFTFEAASFFFAEFNSYLVNIVKSGQSDSVAISSVISTVIEETITNYGASSNEDMPSQIRAYLIALSNNCPTLDASKVDQLSSCLVREWILPHHELSDEDCQENINFSERSPSKDYFQSPGRENLDPIGKPYNLMLKDGSPSEKLNNGSPLKIEGEGQSFSSVVSVNGNMTGKGSFGNLAVSQGLNNGTLKLQYIVALQEEDSHDLEKQRIGFSLLVNVLDMVGLNKTRAKHIVFPQLRASAGQHLKVIPSILKLRKRDWPAEESILKPKIHAKLQIGKAASSVYTKSFLSLKLEGRVGKHALRETLAILIDISDACTVSPWRRLRSCEDLFACTLQNLLDVISLCGSQDLKGILIRLKSLVLATCAQADPWSSNQGPMFESIVKTTCNVIQSIWNTDRAAVESFLLSLAANVRDCSEKEEKGKQVIATMHLNVIQFLADIVLLVHKPEIAEMICPLFVESLEEGDASMPSRLRLQILDSVARIATLGFEKSYREAVILLTRSYMDKLSTVGSTQSRTLAPEATTERVETLPNAFLTIALGLSQAKLRADYRHRLLQLCSDVGLAAEAKSGKSGADLLGPLLPSVAEICSDLDILGVVEPMLLKLFRNLWFYIVLFGLAPPIQKVQLVSKNVSSSAPSLGSMSAVALQAVAGPYLWNTQWSAAVIRITQGTPPLVGSSVKWVEDELELNELHNPGSRRSNNNEKAASAQRAALCAALKDRVEMTSISGMSGVKATYFLAVAFLEILRLNHNGGVLKRSTKLEKLESALTCVFEYLEKPNLAPSIYQCLVGIVHRAFDASMAWLDEKQHAYGMEAEKRQMVIVTHACFLISKMTHRNESVCDLACGLLDKIKLKYPQVLWNSSCLDTLLHLVQTHSSPSLDPARMVSMQNLIKKQIRSWIMRSLSLAPCTTQGLLQERIRALNTWSNGSYTSDLLPLLSDIKLDPNKTDRSGSIMIPATFAASIAAAGARGWMADMGTLEVLSNGIVSANVKSSYIHINIGGLTFGLQDGTAGMFFGASKMDGKTSETAISMKHILKERLIAHFLQLLQQFISKVEQGTTIEPEAFRETCLRSTAFIVSELELSKNVEMENFPKLLRLLCWCPVYICSPDSMSTGVFIWTWLVSAAPHLISVLLAELVDAWLWTIETGLGLFASGPAYSGPRGKLRPHLTPGEPVVAGNKHPVEGIIAHRLWLGFLFDQFEVVRHTSTDQLSLIDRLLQGSLRSPKQFSAHPAATGTFFSLMLLGLKFCSSQTQTHSSSAVSISLLEDRIHRCALSWFSNEPEWYDCNVEGFSQEEAQAITVFAQHLSLDHPASVIVGDRFSKSSIQEGESPSIINLCSQLDNSHPVWGIGDSHGSAREKRKQLLLMLCHYEVERLDTWANPLRESFPSKLRGITSDRWVEYVKTAWSVDPRIALALPSRFPGIGSLRSEIMYLVQAHLEDMYDIPEALSYVITPKAAQENSPILQLLPHWAPCSITRALEFLSPMYKGHPRIMAYVLRVLESYPPERVTFFMPQLVQILRYDDGDLVERYLITSAQRSSLFAHLLIWQLQGEEPPSTEDLSKEQLQEEKAFHEIVMKVKDRIIKSFSSEALDLFEREFRFFDKVTDISGALYPLPKDKRRAGIRRELEKIKVEGLDLYLPTAPTKLVRGIQLDSGIPLQSAAKVPIMVTFDVVDKTEPSALMSQACIFKVGDDCRQDVLALQVIALLRDIFEAVGLNLYLFPYGVLPTGCGKGIIEVVPNTRSRNQMAETTDGGLYEIFQQDFGPVGSSQFEAARDKFIVSSAGYAVASLLLQPKDRHNGNLLFDNEGRLVHIDFGFILETSPGGNMRFESAQFKLSHEMTQLLDPSGAMKSETWNRFVSLCVKGYLAARQHMDSIIITVMLMVDSGLPCFSRGDPIGNLRKRFHPEMSEREAANFMIKTCQDAYNKWTTAGYDLIQYLQQGIEK